MSEISRTTFVFTVLHRTDEPFNEDFTHPDHAFDGPLGEALSRAYDGHAVGAVTWSETGEVPDDLVSTSLLLLGNDGTFFEEPRNDIDLEFEEDEEEFEEEDDPEEAGQ